MLALLIVVASTLSGIPCACAATGEHEVEEREPVSSCCAGNTEVPEETQDDCPHCFTGGCNMTATGADETTQVVASAWTSYEFAFTASHHVGFEPVSDEPEVYAIRVSLAPDLPPLGETGRDTCVQNQVIRC